MRHRFVFLIAAGFFCCLMSPSLALGTGLKREAAEGFDYYVKLAEKRMHGELMRDTTFLGLDTLADSQRRDVRARLGKDDTVITRMHSEPSVRTPGALIHHWSGAIFIPGASLRQVLAAIQDCDQHGEYYAPEVE